MQHLGEVMFLKGLLLALCTAVGVKWVAFRRRRAEKGLPLKLNPRTGVYEISDWAASVERGARGFWNVTLFIVIAANLTAWAIWAIFGWDTLARAMLWVFGPLIA